jgi:hypothetical protein
MANGERGYSGNSPDLVVKLIAAYKSYSNHADGFAYDEAFLEVQAAVERSGSLGKADIGALMLWKRLNLSTRWTRALNNMADRDVRKITNEAIELARDRLEPIPDAARQARQALVGLPGCRNGHAVASTILTAGAPTRMAVYDVRAVGALTDLKCPSPEGSYGNYMETVVGLVEEINKTGANWCPRDVDKALYMLGGG